MIVDTAETDIHQIYPEKMPPNVLKIIVDNPLNFIKTKACGHTIVSFQPMSMCITMGSLKLNLRAV